MKIFQFSPAIQTLEFLLHNFHAKLIQNNITLILGTLVVQFILMKLTMTAKILPSPRIVCFLTRVTLQN
ncbi:hypothetical protein CO690_03930 [Rothia mucilaginosa]|uniref:Uncharacterized protein n=1 Tax=Rothia mucilaginosa TaxID=43675 RepID=A0A291DEG2_9MICC|nr:hypothetical protein CO690_03930 [Rothia mucilaginosa]